MKKFLLSTNLIGHTKLENAFQISAAIISTGLFAWHITDTPPLSVGHLHQ
jgi:hypothetical protein